MYAERDTRSERHGMPLHTSAPYWLQYRSVEILNMSELFSNLYKIQTMGRQRWMSLLLLS